MEIAVGLLEMKKWDFGTTDVGGNTAISWAARKGHRAIMKMLLERENVVLNIGNIDGRTPLLGSSK